MPGWSAKIASPDRLLKAGTQGEMLGDFGRRRFKQITRGFRSKYRYYKLSFPAAC
jgi:hypothetical protein